MIGEGVLRASSVEADHCRVGYIGWLSTGGFGFLDPKYGLGIDQLIAARIVNDKGEEEIADEHSLKAIRGAGGNLGIIVEATVRTYPLEKVCCCRKDSLVLRTVDLRGRCLLDPSSLNPQKIERACGLSSKL